MIILSKIKCLSCCFVHEEIAEPYETIKVLAINPNDFANGNGEKVDEFVKDSIAYAIGRSGQKLFVCDEPITRFSCNRAIVKQDNAIWLVDRLGKKICELHLDEKENYGLWRKSYQSDCLMSLVIKGKASKIDTMGNVVLSTNFSGIGEFINGIAHVWNATQEGYIKENGDLLVLEQSVVTFIQIYILVIVFSITNNSGCEH